MLLYASVTAMYNLPPGMLRAICYTESHHNVYAIHVDDGSSNSLGVCQVSYNTAREMGFTGSEAELMEPATNINYAGLYLRSRLRRNHGNIRLAIAAYNSGSPLFKRDGSLINELYVHKVATAWVDEL
jgi:soluble lytic murein transglycosylase-like protein